MTVSLQPRFIIETAELLRARISERFPGSGLLDVADAVTMTAREADALSIEITKPHLPLRLAVWALGATLILGVAAAFQRAGAAPTFSNVSDLLQGVDAAANIVLLVGAAILSVAKLEESLQRRKALALVHNLKAFAHVIDMHQLTKDPETISGDAVRTQSSPTRTMTRFELGRYLDYSSELLSVIGKIAAIYAQRIQDPVVLEAADSAEDLVTGLSRKIWQKISIISGRP